MALTTLANLHHVLRLYLYRDTYSMCPFTEVDEPVPTFLIIMFIVKLLHWQIKGDGAG